MFKPRETITFKEAADLLGVDRRTVSDLVKAKNITLHPLAPDGKRDRAIDEEGFEILKEVLRPVPASA